MTNHNKSISQIWKELREENAIMRSDKPLAIGAVHQIAAKRADLTDDEIQAVLRRHCRTTTYLRNVKFGGVRMNLDGTVAGEITDLQRECARLNINERNQKKTISMLDQVKPVKSGKKSLARLQKHTDKLVTIQTKLKETVKALKDEQQFQCSLADGDVGMFNN